MNKAKNYFEIVIMFGSGLVIYYQPAYLNDLSIALIAAIILDFTNANIKEISFIRSIYEYLDDYKNRKRIEKILEKERLLQLEQGLLDSALIKIKSSDEKVRKIGFIELEQFKGNEICKKLIEILRNPLNDTHEKEIIRSLCKICKD